MKKQTGKTSLHSTLFLIFLLPICLLLQTAMPAFLSAASPATAAPAATYGNPDGGFPIPPEAAPADISKPDTVIGTGTPESCTAEAFIRAVAKGGTIVFNGGTQPFTLMLDRPAKIFNNAKPDVVIDGGGLVTLSGGGKTRILYMNTCDPSQVWTTDHAQNQDHPRLTVQNLTFADGNSAKETEYDGGGAIWLRGGHFKVFNCRFTNNVCIGVGPDVGGGAIRVFDQYEDLPVYVTNSTFGGKEGMGNTGSNGGAVSSIGVSWTFINCLFSCNRAIGNGGNPAEPGTPGGGSGGAIYNDGNDMTLTLKGTLVENNQVKAYGAGIFFVTNDHSGDIRLEGSIVRNNPGGSWYPVYPGISMHADTKVTVINEKPCPAALPALSPVLATLGMDSREFPLEAYNIGGNHYFKLRDIARMMSGTAKQFEVGWDAGAGLITLTQGLPYTPVGGEWATPAAFTPQAVRKSTRSILLDGKELSLTAYTIRNHTWFKLRDLGEAFDFGVSWDGAAKRILLDPNAGYVP